jgi:hypothetical protein
VEHSGLTSACFTGVASGNIACSSIVESNDNFAVRKQILDNCARQVICLEFLGDTKFGVECNEIL